MAVDSWWLSNCLSYFWVRVYGIYTIKCHERAISFLTTKISDLSAIVNHKGQTRLIWRVKQK